MATTVSRQHLINIQHGLYEISSTFRPDMRVPARVFMLESMIDEILTDRSLIQLVNVATLPGITRYALAMPDIHEGYGFPIGGVAAMSIQDGGVISPGGIGYDINCGVRLLASSISAREIKRYLEELATELFKTIPSGVGGTGSLKYSHAALNEVLLRGVPALLEKDIGVERDMLLCEEEGSMPGARPDLVSDKAKERGYDQLGTLGSGNHFLEVQTVDKIFDQETAHAFGLREGMVTVMIHCGSRGLGHQVCTEYVRSMMPLMSRWGISVPDRKLVCAPFLSEEGQNYFGAMIASANFAWANRHAIAHAVRMAWRKILGKSVTLDLVYDISHNIGKREWHEDEGTMKEFIVHRKGATRAFGPGSEHVAELYRPYGQPVLIPGTMGTASYVLVGTTQAERLSFGSSCHGAGRRMSRMKAKQSIRGTDLRNNLEKRGIIIRCDSAAGLAEEAPKAYKDIESVVEVVDKAPLARKVARLVPLAVIKGG